jgi:16S rRNA (guanine527-N7)-methyltransferase
MAKHVPKNATGKRAGKPGGKPGKSSGRPAGYKAASKPAGKPGGKRPASQRPASQKPAGGPGRPAQADAARPPKSFARSSGAGLRGTRNPSKGYSDGSQGEQKPWERSASWAAKAGKKGPRLGTFARSQQVSRAVYGHTVPPSRSRLEELLKQYGVEMPATVLDKVWQYHQILRKNNGDLDLTRLIGFETIVQRHYADCLILHSLMNGKWPSPMVDIGTGAGFPGLMIKIASPSTKLILSEPRNVRVDFLNNTIQELGLKDIEVFGHKFTSKSFSQPLQGAISRAFEPIGKTLPRLEKSLAVGGLAIFMKGPGVDEELSAKLPSNYKLVRDERYRIPKTTLDRALVIFERTA